MVYDCIIYWQGLVKHIYAIIILTNITVLIGWTECVTSAMCLQSPGKTDVYTYNDFFHGIMDDVLPPGAGPNLLLGYLHRWYVNLGS
jgi:hypothetical protein